MLKIKEQKQLAKSLLFVLITCLCIVCEAQFGGGSGTEEDPWQISRVYHLDDIRNYLGFEHSDKYFIQTSNIDLGLPPWNEEAGWEPIGYSREDSFQGTYDGNGFVISNLYIHRPRTNYQGLFGFTQRANISNLGMIDVNITGRDGTGAVVGWNEQESIITNCYSTGIVQGTLNLGGLLGYSGINCVLKDSFSECRVQGSDARAGGLVGYNDYYSVIRNCFSTGDVNGYRQIGGLVGRNVAFSHIYNSYSTGAVTANNNAGGLVGINFNNATINQSYSTGRTQGYYSTGGLVGSNQNSHVSYSYWNTQTSNQNISDGGLARTTQQMTFPYAANTFTNWNFEEIWKDDRGLVNNGYPILFFQQPLQAPDIIIDIMPPEDAQLLVRISWPAVVSARSYRVYASSEPHSHEWGEPIAHVEENEYLEPVSETGRRFYYVTASHDRAP